LIGTGGVSAQGGGLIEIPIQSYFINLFSHEFVPEDSDFSRKSFVTKIPQRYIYLNEYFHPLRFKLTDLI
jgi:hypothetical protein